MYSYICRLAHENGIASYERFITYYLKPIERKSAKNYQGYYIFNAFFDSVHIDYSPIRFFMEHSIYPYEQLFLNPQQQAHLINQYFGMHTDKYPAIITPIESSINDLHLCPMCRDEEIATYGEYYIHREHNLPGVVCCPKHHVPLLCSTKGDGLYKLEFDKTEKVITDFDIQYSTFANELLQAEIDRDIADLATAVKRKLKEINCHARSKTFNYTDIAREIINDGAGIVFKNNIENIEFFFKLYLSNRNYSDPVRWTTILWFLFRDIKTLTKYLPEVPNTTEIEFLKNVIPEYTLYHPYYRSIVMLKHNPCKRVIYTTQAGFNAGWRCYLCDTASEQEKIEQIISNITNHEYSLTSEFKRMDRKVAIQHKKCGNTLTVTPRGFIEEGVRCKCENRINIEDIRHNIEDSGEFELVNFKGITQPVTIRHKACGKSFSIFYNKFIKRPWCKVCIPATRSHEIFLREIAELTGGEYTVTGNYIDKNTPVEIRHNSCGHTHTYLPRHFLGGSRCPHCHMTILDKDLKIFVESASNGLYTVIGRKTKNLCTIRNTVTGQEIHLSKQKAIAELKRPTPSAILPLTEKVNAASAEKIKNNTDIVSQNELAFEKLFNTYGRDYNAIVFADSVHQIFKENSRIRNKTLINILIRNQKLFRYDNGIYTFHPNLVIEPIKLITEQYIIRNHERIGMLYGKSLAYEWGIIPDKPDTMFIITNQESQKHGRAKTLYGMKIRIKGYPVGISESNYIVISILDIVNNTWHFGWMHWEPKIIEIIKSHRLRLTHFFPYLNYYGEHTKNDTIKLFQSEELA